MSTIAAIATAYSQTLSGGIGIIRISGEKALEIMRKIFVSKQNLDDIKPRFLYYGHFNDSKGNYLDEGLAVFMKAPFSYTAEDTVELHCHGNPNLLTALLNTCFEHGAELADAGEFTKRAFLNGRLDLSQAEAVAEIISAPSLESSRLAEAKLSGLLGKKIKDLRVSLESIMQNLLYELDFSEEELPDISPFIESVQGIQEQIKNLLLAYERTAPWRDGSLVVLAGKVNAGKSSLFNALLGRYRAIVTAQAGTTRDYIEEVLKIQDIPIRLVDTAGIRAKEETSDLIELEGIQSAYKLFEEARVILYMLDTKSDLQIDKKHIEFLEEVNPKAKVLLVWNKCDILPYSVENGNIKNFRKDLIEAVCPISAKEGNGIDALAKSIHKALSVDGLSGDELAPNLRQAHLLEKAETELEQFLENAYAVPPDALAIHLAESVRVLGEITGEIVTEEIVNSIFSTFCVGK